MLHYGLAAAAYYHSNIQIRYNGLYRSVSTQGKFQAKIRVSEREGVMHLLFVGLTSDGESRKEYATQDMEGKILVGMHRDRADI